MTGRNRQKGRRERVGRKGGREGKRVVQRKQAEFMHVCNFQIKIIKKTKALGSIYGIKNIIMPSVII